MFKIFTLMHSFHLRSTVVIFSFRQFRYLVYKRSYTTSSAVVANQICCRTLQRNTSRWMCVLDLSHLQDVSR